MERDELRMLLVDVRKTKRKLSQRELAQTLHCHQSMMSDWEYGRVWPSTDNLIRWIDGLDVTLRIDISRGRICYTLKDLKDGQLWP